MPFLITARGATHVGTVRKRNEDAFIDRSDIGIWAVADGAGGHGAGDVASATVVAALAALPVDLAPGEKLAEIRRRLAEVHAGLQRQAAGTESGVIATTIVVMLAHGDHFACLWAGDSRAYLLRHGVLTRITRDHSLVQELVDQGTLAAEDAERHPQANVITRAIGGAGELELDKVSGRFEDDDLVLLCTDGLFKALPEEQIGILLMAGASPEQLLAAANEARARDNVTAVMVRAREKVAA
ncbi:PP2C family protein-serine/threonine phosphatase [Siccirubricoccus phaeus]|uniref:PP2C family protein-serine/threonine phosphatase n=1 Tax=Siccirubricoccus phaeus TaxID=2595053 RepID=UPI0011F2BA03|nr:protein phosphatase 2C domain-containing protein [Siccirubricoccus phaeus]